MSGKAPRPCRRELPHRYRGGQASGRERFSAWLFGRVVATERGHVPAAARAGLPVPVRRFRRSSGRCRGGKALRADVFRRI